MAYNRKEEYLAVVKQPKQITDELLETIDYIARARDAELSFDKTIIAEIVSLNNADTGEYFVEYQKGKFRAYAPIGINYTYSKGTNVYVKIPGGDFTQKKTIEGKVSASSYTEEEYEDLSQQVIEVNEIHSDGNEYGILAYAPEGNTYYEKVIYSNEKLEENSIFTSLISTYPNIMISADFRTQFYGTMVAGNYGLKIEFEEKDTGVIFTRRLDITNFSGSIYNYEVFSPQYAIYNFQGINLLGVRKITFFQERFIDYDKVYNSKNELIQTYDEDPNIFCKNIKLCFVDLQDTTKDLYYVGISAPQGLSLIYDTDSIVLKGVFYYANKDILDKKNCVCYWYKQNPAILSGDEKYDKIAGPGWELINDKTKVNFNELTVSGKDVYQQMRYKLVVVYNSSVTLSKDVRVVKYYNERFTIIRNDVSDTEVKLEIVDGREKTETADWYVDLMDGSYVALDKNVSSIDVSKYLDYGTVMFYTVSLLEDGKYVPCEYKLTNYQSDIPVRVIFNGNDTFQYDKNNSITIDQSESEMIITPTITVNKDNVGIKTVTWYSPDGGQLFEYATTKITNSMISRLWVNPKDNSVHFNIRQKRIAGYTNNTLILKVITLTDKEYYFNKTIYFSKQGEYDLNGRDYTFIIKQCDENGNEISKRPLNKIGDNYNPIYFKAELRLDGEIITADTKYKDEEGNVLGSYNLNLKRTDIHVSSEKLTDTIYKVNNFTEDKQGQYFIKFSLTVGIKGKTEGTKVLNYWQPIMVSENIDINNIKEISIPDRITYDSSGTASYHSINAISFIYYCNRVNVQLIGPYSYSMTSNLFLYPLEENGQKTGYYKLIPTSTFGGAYFAEETDTVSTSPMGAIYITIPTDRYGDNTKRYLVYPIVMLIERDRNVSDVEEDDGTDIPVLDEENPEFTKPIKPSFSHQGGKYDQIARPQENEQKGYLGGRTYIGDAWEKYRKIPTTNPVEPTKPSIQKVRSLKNETDTSGYVSGLYQYDNDDIPTNILRADGLVKLGGDKLTIDIDGNLTLNENTPSNILTIAKLLNELTSNVDFKQELINNIVPPPQKNIKIRNWYIEE